MPELFQHIHNCVCRDDPRLGHPFRESNGLPAHPFRSIGGNALDRLSVSGHGRGPRCAALQASPQKRWRSAREPSRRRWRACASRELTEPRTQPPQCTSCGPSPRNCSGGLLRIRRAGPGRHTRRSRATERPSPLDFSNRFGGRGEYVLNYEYALFCATQRPPRGRSMPRPRLFALAPPRDVAAHGVNTLLEQLHEIQRRGRHADAGYTAPASALPWWCEFSPPMYINSRGELHGQQTGWPLSRDWACPNISPAIADPAFPPTSRRTSISMPFSGHRPQRLRSGQSPLSYRTNMRECARLRASGAGRARSACRAGAALGMPIANATGQRRCVAGAPGTGAVRHRSQAAARPGRGSARTTPSLDDATIAVPIGSCGSLRPALTAFCATVDDFDSPEPRTVGVYRDHAQEGWAK
jgi:hypothetical protein